MYIKIEGSPKMTENEASLRYPDNYILMQKDNKNTNNPSGVVLYVGNNFSELFALQVDLSIPLGIVIEGANLQRRLCLGGVIVG
ncbi:MAG: hypothetical protein LBE35_03980 [Clostridiales bacterium]|nr:hypothetical protein [Clostridiales bacterium]